MSQHYSDPSRESDPHALPNIETFHMSATDFAEADPDSWMALESDTSPEDHAGWYWWSCFPGCMPDGDAEGPFETEALALADAREE